MGTAPIDPEAREFVEHETGAEPVEAVLVHVTNHPIPAHPDRFVFQRIKLTGGQPIRLLGDHPARRRIVVAFIGGTDSAYLASSRENASAGGPSAYPLNAQIRELTIEARGELWAFDPDEDAQLAVMAEYDA